jgi:predicted Zn-dependent peptidase
MIVEEDFDSLSRNDLVDFYKHFYCSSRCTIIASGAIKEKDIFLIEKCFGNEEWNNNGLNNEILYSVIPEKERKIYIEKPGAVQNSVRMGKELFNKLHTDYIGMSVVNCILGGYFGSRLMKTIREDKGYTYGINSLFVTLRYSGYISIASDLGTKVTKNAINEIYDEIEKLRTELVPEPELERVKNYILGEVVRMFDGPFAQAESLISLLEYNFGYEYYDNYIKNIKLISAQQVLLLAKKYLDPASFFEVVVGVM